MWTGIVQRFSSDDQESFSPLARNASDRHRENDEHIPNDSANDGINGILSPATVFFNSSLQSQSLDPIVLHGFRDSTSVSARLLTSAIAEEIRTMLPERLRIVEDWRLVYSLEQDGASLVTLYQKCRPYEGRRLGFVLVVKDQEAGTFGAYLSEYPHPSPSYFGNGECFLWRISTVIPLLLSPSADATHLAHYTNPTLSHSADNGTWSPGSESIRFKAFPYSGLNDCYINCEAGFLSVGSGSGHYGLWLDDSLDVGHSSRCDTFGNEPLSDAGEKFSVLGVELWVLGA